jgi:hypothetical protein
VLYESRIPGPPVNAYVEYLWALSDRPAHTKERIVPSGTLELVINLSEDQLRIYDAKHGSCRRLAGKVVSGAYRGFFGIDTRAHASIIGAHFRPGGAAPFLGLPPGEPHA